MPTFAYTAIEAKTGRERAGTMECNSPEEASASLKARGLAPIAIATATDHSSPASPRPLRRKLSTITLGPPVKGKALTAFTRQLATLAKARMPLVRALEVLSRQEKNPAFRAIIDDVAETVRTGGSFSDGLARHPRIFDRLFLNMAKAGEAGGVLEIVMERVALFREKAERVKAKVKSAMTYPIIVITLAVGIVAALMVFVVPKFEEIFASMLKGQPLPALTQAVLNAGRFVSEHALLSAAFLFSAGVLFAFFRRMPFGQRAFDWLAIRAPLVGDLLLKAAIARFARTFGTLLSSGVPILQALAITGETSGNVHVSAAIDVVRNRVQQGENVAAPLAGSRLFPAMVASMIEVGEETGSLAEMLGRIADVYDEEVDHSVASLTSLLEPLMIVFLALLVGTIVIALFLPILSIVQNLH